ncbi:pol polyprotein [Tanacetum coccineum]
MGSDPLNSCEPARPADTNAAPVVHLRAYLFTASFDKVPEYSKEVYLINSKGMTKLNSLLRLLFVDPNWCCRINTVANHAERPERKVQWLYLLPKVNPYATGCGKAVEHGKHSRTSCAYIYHAGSSSRFNSKGNKKDKRKNDKKSKGKSEYLAPKAGIVKQKFQGTCYNCDQPGHRAANYKMPKRVNLVAVDNGQKLYMGNYATVDIKGEGDVVLKRTSEKELKLTNVLYASVENQMYVGKGYAVNAMFKLNVMVVKNDINKMNSSAYLIESSNVWHGRLGHVRLSSPAVQQLWTLYPGKQTANLF